MHELPNQSSSIALISLAVLINPTITKCHSTTPIIHSQRPHPPIVFLRHFHASAILFLLLLLLLSNSIGAMLIDQQQQIGGFSSVCQFPKLDDWLHCQRDQQQQHQHLSLEDVMEAEEAEAQKNAQRMPLNGWFCDPESSISMSEVSALDESVRQLYAEHGHHTCVCPMPTRPRFPPSLQQQQPELHANNDDHQMTFPLPPEMPSEEEGNDADEAIDRHRNQHLMYNRRKNGWGSKSAGNDADDDGTSSTPTTTKTTTMPQLQLSPHCWHRFGFAFIRQLHPGADVLRADQCGGSGSNNMEADGSAANLTAATNVQRHPPQRFELPTDWESNADQTFTMFANNFAHVLRERWRSALGAQCGEDLLLLVVQRPPVQQLSSGPLSAASGRLYGQLPMLFVAPGPLVQHRLGPRLDTFVRDANAQLQRDARPLFRVLGHFLLRVGAALAERNNDDEVEEDDADDDVAATVDDENGANAVDVDAIGSSGTGAVVFAGGGGGVGGVPQRFSRRRHKSRSHVPLWAWLVFAACGVAFALMALGLFLIRTGTRRSSAPSAQQQSGQIARRYWKEGEDQLPTQTYVNLVQMLMPHPKPPPVNMPQQV